MKTAEEALLLAALDGDAASVRHRLRYFLPGERAALICACRLIEWALRMVERDERYITPPEEGTVDA